MSATTTDQTFQDCYAALLNRVRVTLGSGRRSTTNLNYAKHLINEALHDLHIQQNWWWAERDAVLLTHDTYTTGRVSIASTARTTLEGSSGTLWNTAVSGMGFNNLRVGSKIVLGGEVEVYTVSGVTSDTAATLESRYIGGQTTATAYALAYGTYTIFEDEYALASDFWRLVDARTFSQAMNLPVVGKQEFYREFPRNSVPGIPKIATLIELGPSGDVNLRPRVLLAPPPNDVYQIPYRYLTSNLAISSAGAGATNLSADADEPIVPLRYRHVLVAYAAKRWFLYLKDDARSQEAESEYVDLVKRMANDSDPQRDHPVLRPRRAQYLQSVAGPYWRVGRSRYSADTRFDELRDR